MPQTRRTVSQEDLKRDPYAVWNAYVDLLAMSEYRDLGPSQRPAHLVFWYESEVQNGGHLQYFINRGVDRVEETIEALRTLGASDQAQVLRQAIDLWNSKPRVAPTDVDEYVEEALEMEFAELDESFDDCQRDLTTVLGDHLSSHESEFIVRS